MDAYLNLRNESVLESEPEEWICLLSLILPSSARGGISTSKRSPGQLGIALRAPPKDAIGRCQHRLPGRV